MVTALQSKAQLGLLADDAAETVSFMVRRTSGSWESRRLQLLDTVPGVAAFYSEASTALAVDLYADSRAAAGVSSRFAVEQVVLDRTVKIRRGVAWASEPLAVGDDPTTVARLAIIAQKEMHESYRDTIITNQRRDPSSVGWQRIARAGACGMCRMLADRGAVYRQSTATFAAHNDCRCTAAPIFRGGEVGPEADAMQYMVSRRSKTPAQRARIREYLKANYPD